MARLLTCGFEMGHATAEDINLSLSGSPTVTTTNPRSGNRCLEVDAATEYVQWTSTGALNRGWYSRAGIRMSGTPSNNVVLMQVNRSGGGCGWIILNTSRQLVLQNAAGTTLFTSSALTVGQYYIIELLIKLAAVPTTINGTIEMRLDTVSQFNSSAANVGTSAPTNVQFGVNGASTPGVTLSYDDIAVNDDTGGSETSWPGDGKIVMLMPVSDVSRVGYGVGAGTNSATTTNLFDAINNTPPTAVAIASSTATTQIKDKANNTTDNYVMNLGAYTASLASGGGGMASIDVVKLVQCLVHQGQDSSTLTAIGQTVTNPTIAEAVGNSLAAVAGTFPTNWQPRKGFTQYSPTVTLGTQPTVTVRSNTASATINKMIAFVGLLVEYTVTPTTTYTDSPSGTVTALTGSITDTHLFTEAPNGSLAPTGTNAEANTRATSQSGTVTPTGSITATHVFTEAPAGTIGTPTGSNTNQHVFTEGPSGSCSPTGTNGEACTRSVSPTGSVTPTGTNADALGFADSQSGSVTPTGTRTEALVFTDGSTGTVTITGSNSDSYTTGGPVTYTDNPSGTVTISGSMGESSTHACSPTGSVSPTGTRTESFSFSDGPTGSVTPSGTSTESIRFSDGPAGSLVPTGTATDALAFSDGRTGSVTPSGTRSDLLTYSDSATGPIEVTGSITEIYTNPNAGAEPAAPDVMEGSIVFWVPRGSGREVRLTRGGVRTIAHGVSERTFDSRSGRSTVEVEQ